MKTYTKTFALLLITAVAAQASQYVLELTGWSSPFTTNRAAYGPTYSAALATSQPMKLTVSFDTDQAPYSVGNYAFPRLLGYNYTLEVGPLNFDGFTSSSSGHQINLSNNPNAQTANSTLRASLNAGGSSVEMFGLQYSGISFDLVTTEGTGTAFPTRTLYDLINIDLNQFIPPPGQPAGNGNGYTSWRIETYSPVYTSIGGWIDGIRVYPAVIPEPSSFAAIAGFGVLALAATRRRRN